MSKIKAVFFDVGNTLMNFDYELVWKAVPHIPRTAIDDVAADVWKELNEQFEARRDDNREIDTLRFIIRGLLERVGVNAHGAYVESILAEHTTMSLWRKVNNSAKQAVLAMKGMGIRTAVISNADGKVEDLLVQNGWQGVFEFIIDSGIVGVSKPDPEIFRIALDRMGIRPEESAYVGDIPAIDVRGAAAAGMTPILYDPANVYGEEFLYLEQSLTVPLYRITKMEHIHCIL